MEIKFIVSLLRSSCRYFDEDARIISFIKE
jgi:hypothetical protein